MGLVLLPTLFAGLELIQVLICARWGLTAATVPVSKHTDAASARADTFCHYDGSSTLENVYLGVL